MLVPSMKSTHACVHVPAFFTACLPALRRFIVEHLCCRVWLRFNGCGSRGIRHRHIEFPEPTALDKEFMEQHQPKLQKALKAAALGMFMLTPFIRKNGPRAA